MDLLGQLVQTGTWLGEIMNSLIRPMVPEDDSRLRSNEIDAISPRQIARNGKGSREQTSDEPPSLKAAQIAKSREVIHIGHNTGDLGVSQMGADVARSGRDPQDIA